MKKKNITLPKLAENSFLIDTHCHLDMEHYANDLNQIIDRAISKHVKGIITIGIDLKSSQSAIEIARNHNNIRATIGIHPHEAAGAVDKDLASMANLFETNRKLVVGYGEIGLDYVKKHSSLSDQQKLFRKQLGLAKELKLPIIIHDREAHEDCLNAIKQEGPFDQGGIMHCFSGDLSFAEKVIDHNLHVSIPGIVTFKNAHALKEVAAKIPISRLLLETDGPYLAPEPFRGKPNEPAYLLFTAATIAEIRNQSIEHIADRTSSNACSLFGYDFAEI